ncbi:HAD family hydrolase [Staphylothermus hellenicus]|uniref:HAD-superfamily hydrolase, subfamily IA, variant 1 n=1 Tax=Staphylothermus hellenicus (strain DSM 12710 / JCM 10830 / BK20S6-10-b1 / P8) TaxID=591019 RepID=D7DCF9_STAHD|nr:HAD family hydrolase [Staphylothermus hellenicus]ADI31856.1 HAD-superfamily hydrolase, subfamily IA, variant 1 [Staphylothermus hellenicus DSM 12710]
MIKLVSFDIWKTLLDTMKFYQLISEKLSSQTGKPIENVHEELINAYNAAIEARLKGLFKKPVYDSAKFFAEKLGISIDDLFKATVQAILDERIKNIRFPDSEQALKELKSRNLKIAFLGNVLFWPGMATRIILEQNKLLKYADITLFGDEIGVQKPDKEVFKILADLANCKVDEILHVGDSLVNDFAGALIAGTRAALIKREMKNEIIILNNKAYIINSLMKVPEIVDLMNSYK